MNFNFMEPIQLRVKELSFSAAKETVKNKRTTKKQAYQFLVVVILLFHWPQISFVGNNNVRRKRGKKRKRKERV